MISLTVSGETMEDIQRSLGLAVGVPASAPAKEPVKEKKTKAAEPASPVDSVPAPPVQSAPATTGKLTLNDIGAVIPKLVNKIGKEKVVEILATFGATKGSNLKESDYEAFMAIANGHLG